MMCLMVCLHKKCRSVVCGENHTVDRDSMFYCVAVRIVEFVRQILPWLIV